VGAVSDALRIGGRTVSRVAARDYVTRYLTTGHGFAYPAYDGYQRESATGSLVDGDLLAPVLLNVRYLSIETYEALRSKVPFLQQVLDQIPAGLDLLDAADDDLSLLGRLFSALDGEGVSGAQGTVLSKLLHRKRPRFVPLYDERVRSVYQDGEQAPVPTVSGRPWGTFMPLFARAVRQDLSREMAFYRELATLAVDPPIGPLRALDIVAWWAGGSGRRPRVARRRRHRRSAW
jgi:hypothetical protein